MRKEKYIEEVVRELKGKDSNIAIHGIHHGTDSEKKAIAKSILIEGLKLQHGWRTILATMISLRNTQENPNFVQDMINFQYGFGEQYNIIAKVPNFISNSEGKRIFLGFPPLSKKTAGIQYNETCILDLVCAKLGKIPSELILGYYNSSLRVKENPNYYEELSQKQKDEFFEMINDALPALHKKISDYVVNGDIMSLEEMKKNAITFKSDIIVQLVDDAIKTIEELNPRIKFTRGLKEEIVTTNNPIRGLKNSEKVQESESEIEVDE